MSKYLPTHLTKDDTVSKEEAEIILSETGKVIEDCIIPLSRRLSGSWILPSSSGEEKASMSTPQMARKFSIASAAAESSALGSLIPMLWKR